MCALTMSGTARLGTAPFPLQLVTRIISLHDLANQKMTRYATNVESKLEDDVVITKAHPIVLSTISSLARVGATTAQPRPVSIRRNGRCHEGDGASHDAHRTSSRHIFQNIEFRHKDITTNSLSRL